MGYFTLSKLVREIDLKIIYKAKNFYDIQMEERELNRPGLQLSGFYEKFQADRIQIIGNQEWYYLEGFSDSLRYQRTEELFKHGIHALLFTSGNSIFKEVLDLAKKYDITILSTKEKTSKIINKITNFIDMELAPTTRVHGVLLDVYGVGVLIEGKSGVGKSETALDLISKGAKLISDDSVIIKAMDGVLIGRSPEITKHFMEIRGIGIIDVQKLFGVGSIMEKIQIEMVINLESWDEKKEYVRLGLEDLHENILGINCVKYEIPVKPGRHTALIIEVAAKTYKQKQFGYNPAKVLNERILQRKEKNQR